MPETDIRPERAQNLWASFARKFEPVAQATSLDAHPDFELSRIGGLAAAKEEIQTYACAATAPEFYARWGTHPPSGILLIGGRSVGKRLLAGALATLTRTPFLSIAVPRLVLEVIHRGAKVGELVAGWSEVLHEMPPLTVLFNELEFSQAEEIGARRTDLPIGPVMDFLLDLLDRTIAVEGALVVGATSHPDTLRRAFAQPGRLERIVECTPVFPGDIVEILRIHAEAAEKRAGHALFDGVDWRAVVSDYRAPAPGDWVHVLHATLRRKARVEACGEKVATVTTADLLAEVSRWKQAASRLAMPAPGTYV
ncbi:MAG TPA: AAA family ATPase [Myxococcota bacterium]|nr:AAA family ATPase [Myxococcota bacterium]